MFNADISSFFFFFFFRLMRETKIFYSEDISFSDLLLKRCLSFIYPLRKSEHEAQVGIKTSSNYWLNQIYKQMPTINLMTPLT